MRLSNEEGRELLRTGKLPVKSEPSKPVQLPKFEPEDKELGGIHYFRYQGKILSNNQMKSLHWRKLKKLVDPLKVEFTKIIRSARLPKMKTIEIIAEYRSRHDCDNVAATLKICTDILVKLGYLPDDNKRHVKSIKIEYCDTLPNNTIDFTIIEI